MLRELLFIIRLWGRTNDGILPSYTKTSESFDVLAKLFSLLTRFKEGGNLSNEAIIGDFFLNISYQSVVIKVMLYVSQVTTLK